MRPFVLADRSLFLTSGFSKAMNYPAATAKNAPYPPLRPELANQLSLTRDRCIDCPKCVAQCAFLKKYGTPKKIAAACDPSALTWLTMAFQCNLCELCAVVCPVKLAPGDLFLEMRREAVDRGIAPLPAHKGIMAYEGRGISKRYSWYSLPANCRSVFFPGCTFSGTRMDTTIALYEYLKIRTPEMGIVLDCCCKPSHDLGRSEFFNQIFIELRSWLAEHGVQTVITACPNCYKVFKTHGEPLAVKSVYEFLAQNGLPEPSMRNAMNLLKFPRVSIHDPCVLRDEEGIHTAVRDLAAAKGFSVEEMLHGKRNTVCCGEGGAVGFVASEFASSWSELRRKEAGGRRLLTYCAGCAGILNKKIPTDHILDAIFHPVAVAAGKRKATKPPWTYLNRIRLKRYLQKHHPAAVTREREFPPVSKKQRGGGILKKIILLIVIAAAVAGIHFSGALHYSDSVIGALKK
jgi:Fe-S oxidoreductase